MKNTEEILTVGPKIIGLLFLSVAFLTSKATCANVDSDKEDSATVFCLDWTLTKTEDSWIHFIFRPPEKEIDFLEVGKEFGPGRNALLNTCELPQLRVKLENEAFELPPLDDEIVNPNVRYAVFYSVGHQSNGNVSLSRNTLERRLASFFRDGTRLLPSSRIIKIFLSVNIYKIDCQNQRFVLDRSCASDYILVKLEKNTARVVGYNTDSLSNTIGSAPNMLSNR